MEIADPASSLYIKLGAPVGALSFTQDNQLGLQRYSRLHYRTPTEPAARAAPVFEPEDWRVIKAAPQWSEEMPRIDGQEGTLSGERRDRNRGPAKATQTLNLIHPGCKVAGPKCADASHRVSKNNLRNIMATKNSPVIVTYQRLNQKVSARPRNETGRHSRCRVKSPVVPKGYEAFERMNRQQRMQKAHQQRS